MRKWLKERWVNLLLLLVGIVLSSLPPILGEFCRPGGAQYTSPVAKYISNLEVFVLCELSQRAGEAVLIALALAISVDFYLKKKIVEEVSAFIRGSHLPLEMRHEMDHVVRLKLYRSDYEVNLELVDAGRGMVTLKSSLSYFLNNPTNEDLPFDFATRLEDSPVSKLIQAGASGVVDAKGESADFVDPGPSLTLQSGMLEWKRRTFIPASTVRRARFWIETARQLRECDELTTYSREPTVRYRITVKCPTDFDVRVHFGYHNQSLVRPLPEHKPTSWSLNAALLPQAAVSILWKKRSASSARNVSTDSASFLLIVKAILIRLIRGAGKQSGR